MAEQGTMTSRFVHLGFEIGGDPGHRIPVLIPIRHMAVTGQTQESGKTTALTALISRCGLPAIAFITKRGESEIPGRQILPYFHERADWQFVQSILESTMKERMKFERAWIVRACQGARTLADVQRNIIKLEATAKNALSKDVYMLLGEYLQRVVPMIAKLPKGNSMYQEFGAGAEAGLRVMDLTAYPEELQMLVISSTLHWFYEKASGVIMIIPEAWKFIPQSRNTPVKISAEKLAREGAALRNYLWIDSQDMAAVDKMMLRACAVWLIGVQREANEIKRALSNMPAGLKKPKAEAVATLELGQFYACYGSEIRKTYVQPAWMDETVAGKVAAGRLSVHDLAVTAKSPGRASDHLLGLTERQDAPRAMQPAAAGTGRVESPAGSAARSHSPSREAVPQTIAREDEEMEWKERFESEKRRADKLELEVSRLTGIIEKIERQENKDYGARMRASGDATEDNHKGPHSYTPAESFDNEQLYQAFKARLTEEAPGILVSLTKKVNEIEVREVREKIVMDTTTREGRIALLIADGFFSVNRINAEVVNELASRGLPTSAPNVKHAFDALTEKGFLVAKDKGRYLAVEGMKVNIIRGQAA
jgi:hypothetical protein